MCLIIGKSFEKKHKIREKEKAAKHVCMWGEGRSQEKRNLAQILNITSIYSVPISQVPQLISHSVSFISDFSVNAFKHVPSHTPVFP